MSSTYSHDSQACCTIPPVQSDYQPKGLQRQLSGYETYEAGSGQDAVICVYDIFGNVNQTKQGADAIAQLGFNVYVPDLFRGQAVNPDVFKQPNPMESIGKFIGANGPPPKKAADVLQMAQDLRKEGKQSVSVYGLCWGGKVITLLGGNSEAKGVINGVASLHPAMVKKEDFAALQVPIAFFPSKDEPADECKASWEEVQKLPTKDKSVFKTYDTVPHGFAGARGDMKDPEHVKQFTDVYGRLGTFLKSVK